MGKEDFYECHMFHIRGECGVSKEPVPIAIHVIVYPKEQPCIYFTRLNETSKIHIPDCHGYKKCYSTKELKWMLEIDVFLCWK